MKEEILHLIVVDNGCGIPPETLEYIHRGEKPPQADHGIGIHNVSRRLKLLGKGNQLRVQSKLGLGTKISMEIPATYREDEPLEQQSLKDILEWNFSCGVDIKTASNGVDAISTATIWHADLVLMDIEMPGCNGIVAANKIAKVNPLTKFIIITAYERFEYAHEAVRLHAVDYLLKPVEDAVLVSTIQRLIQEREEENALQQRVLEVQAPSQELTSQTRSELLIKNVEDYIRKNYRYDISQEIICDILNMSTGHFSKLFRQYYGVKFIDFLTNIRVEAAKELLLDPTKRTKEIGEMVGYPSSSYFSKIFRQKTGMTPSEYRTKYIESPR